MESLFKPNSKEEIEREIEEELRFHLDLLTQAGLQHMTLEDAKDAALKSFGNFEQIKEQCVEISRRNHPSMRALKFFLFVVLLVGVLMRVLSIDPNIRHCGDLLIAVPILTRLLLYVRGLSPSTFFSKPETSSPLMLRETSFAAYDQRGLTPFERVISDK